MAVDGKDAPAAAAATPSRARDDGGVRAGPQAGAAPTRPWSSPGSGPASTVAQVDGALVGVALHDPVRAGCQVQGHERVVGPALVDGTGPRSAGGSKCSSAPWPSGPGPPGKAAWHPPFRTTPAGTSGPPRKRPAMVARPGAGLVAAERVVIQEDLRCPGQPPSGAPPARPARAAPSSISRGSSPPAPRTVSSFATALARALGFSPPGAGHRPARRRAGRHQRQPFRGAEAQGAAEPVGETDPDPAAVEVDLDEGVRRVGVHPAHEQQVEVGDQLTFGDPEPLAHLGDRGPVVGHHPGDDGQQTRQALGGAGAAHGRPADRSAPGLRGRSATGRPRHAPRAGPGPRRGRGSRARSPGTRPGW